MPFLSGHLAGPLGEGGPSAGLSREDRLSPTGRSVAVGVGAVGEEGAGPGRDKERGGLKRLQLQFPRVGRV